MSIAPMMRGTVMIQMDTRQLYFADTSLLPHLLQQAE
jgi:hypothetical protein